MSKLLIFSFASMFCLYGRADYIRCSGNISFWANENKAWHQVKLKPGEVYEADHNHLSTLKIGEYLKFPAATISPFFGIYIEIINKKITTETDKSKFFKISYENKKLSCSVKNEAEF